MQSIKIKVGPILFSISTDVKYTNTTVRTTYMVLKVKLAIKRHHIVESLDSDGKVLEKKAAMPCIT